MKNLFLVCGLAITISACHPMRPKKLVASDTSLPDSLKVTVTAFNLSEDLTGNDELLIICYSYKDTLSLNAPIFQNRITFHSKNSARQIKVKISEGVFKGDLILFVLEQDSNWPTGKIDSTLRVSHVAIRKEFARRNYTGIEAYLADEDVLGIKLISPLTCSEPYITNFSGIYKLDRFEYQISIECLN